MPSSGPRSQCALGSKSNCGGSPTRRTSTLSRGVLAHRHGFVRHVGNAGQQLLELGVERLHLLVERGDLRLQRAHLLLLFGGVGAFPAQLADLGALRRSARAFSCSASVMAARRRTVEFAEPVEIRRVAARGQARGDAFEVVPEICEIVHFPPC